LGLKFKFCSDKDSAGGKKKMSHDGHKRKKAKLFPEIMMGDNSPSDSESGSGSQSGPDDTDDGDGGISDGSQAPSR
jgi:hypothetical protein